MSANRISIVADNTEIFCDKNMASHSRDKTKVPNCEFKKSDLFKNIRYPVILMRISCIFVPACCVCETSQCFKSENESRDTEAPNTSPREHTSSKEVHQLQKAVNSKHRCPNSESACLTIFKKALCFIMIFLHGLTVIRYIFILKMTFSERDSFIYSLAFFLVMENYFFLLIFNSYACVKYFTPFISAAFKYDNKYNRKRPHKVYVLLFWLIITCQIAIVCFSIYGMLFYSGGMKDQLWPFLDSNSKWAAVLATITLSGGLFLGMSIVCGPTFFQVAIIYMLTAELKQMEQELRIILMSRNDTLDREVSFENVLDKFRDASELIDTAYKLVKHTTASVYIFSTPSVCLVLYGLISDSIKPDQYIIMSLVMFGALFLLVHTTWINAALNSQVYALCDTVYAADWCKFSQQMIQKIIVFTTMFQVKTFGMSVYGMFVLDWSTLTMVGGTLLTYGLVVIQFQIDSP